MKSRTRNAIYAAVITSCGLAGILIWREASLYLDIDHARGLCLGVIPNYSIDSPDPKLFSDWEKDSYPASGAFSSSTEFFRNLVIKGRIQPFFEIYSAPGIPACDGNDPSMFRPENNAWCVTTDLNPLNLPQCPYMFTRNLDITSISDARADRLRDIPPYGRRGVLVIMTDCSAKFIPAKQIESEFNPLGLTNAVLRP